MILFSILSDYGNNWIIKYPKIKKEKKKKKTYIKSQVNGEYAAF